MRSSPGIRRMIPKNRKTRTDDGRRKDTLGPRRRKPITRNMNRIIMESSTIQVKRIAPSSSGTVASRSRIETECLGEMG